MDPGHHINIHMSDPCVCVLSQLCAGPLSSAVTTDGALTCAANVTPATIVVTTQTRETVPLVRITYSLFGLATCGSGTDICNNGSVR